MPDTRRVWVVWSVGVFAYIVAVLHRTSLGVAGVEAGMRFGVSASVLATFVVLQLVVYASLQVPVGVMVDRFGPRRLILTGAVVMTVGQVVLATADSFGPALVARVLVGAGDAMTFISVLRLVAAWFPAAKVPTMTQITGLTGQLGQVVSAFPLVALLQGPGWTAAFGSAAGLGVLVVVLVTVALRDTPAGVPARGANPSVAQVRAELVEAWRHPGTRLGLWTHFTTQFSGTVFALLWGFPFLTAGEGLAAPVASSLLTVLVVVGVAVAIPLGRAVARHPLRRSWLVLGIVASTAAAWTVVLAWPGPAPVWLLALLMVVLALGGPGSMIGFDFARTFNPPTRLGSATGIVNVGGFVASLLTILALGFVLDVVGDGGASSLDDFRLAWCVQYVTWVVGVAGILTSRRRVRRRLADAGVHVPPIRQAIARERAVRRDRRRP